MKQLSPFICGRVGEREFHGLNFPPAYRDWVVPLAAWTRRRQWVVAQTSRMTLTGHGRSCTNLNVWANNQITTRRLQHQDCAESDEAAVGPTRMAGGRGCRMGQLRGAGLRFVEVLLPNVWSLFLFRAHLSQQTSEKYKATPASCVILPWLPRPRLFCIERLGWRGRYRTDCFTVVDCLQRTDAQ